MDESKRRGIGDGKDDVLGEEILLGRGTPLPTKRGEASLGGVEGEGLLLVEEKFNALFLRILFLIGVGLGDEGCECFSSFKEVGEGENKDVFGGVLV